VATTAYVAHSLLYSGISADDGAIQDAVDYLEANVEKTDNWDDPYVLALALKVLAAAGKGSSSLASDIADQLHELRKEDNGTVYWGTATNMISNDYFGGGEMFDMGYSNPSFNIEATGYAAQALHMVGRHGADVDGALKYLLDHRSSQGGYFSTQDTVVAFQSIYEVSTKQAPVDIEVEILVNGELAWTQTMDETNRDLTYLFDLRPLLEDPTTSVRLRASGEGFVMFQVFWEQWIPWDDTPSEEPLTLEMYWDDITPEIGVWETISVDVTNHNEFSMQMALVELVAPVGMVFNIEALEDLLEMDKVDNVEFVDDMCRIYIVDLESDETIHFEYALQGTVEANVTVAGNRVFDMYNAMVEMEVAPFKIDIGQ